MAILSMNPFFMQAQEEIQVVIPDNWSSSLGSGVLGDTVSAFTWWEILQDDQLNQLIDVARSSNYNVMIALSRIDQQRLAYQIQQSQYYPSMSLESGYNMQQLSQSNKTVNRPGSAFLNMSWEVDVFGRIRKSVKSAKADYLASIDDYNSVMVSLFSDVAQAYVDLRTYQKRLEVAKSNVESQRETLEITKARYTSGLASDLDVAQAMTIVASTDALIPFYESMVDVQINSLGVLLGKYPWELRQQLTAGGEIPDPPEAIAVGVPRDLVRNRPDIQSLENQILAQAESLGATRSQILPQFYINGSFGYQSEQFQNFVEDESMTWSLGASAVWTFFDGFNIQRNVKYDQVLLESLEYDYNQSILQAMQEADNAMTKYLNSQKQVAAQELAVEAASKTFRLSLDLYKSGLADFQTVLDSQRSLLSYADQLAVDEGEVIQNLIQLYAALGGGWDPDVINN